MNTYDLPFRGVGKHSYERKRNKCFITLDSIEVSFVVLENFMDAVVFLDGFLKFVPLFLKNELFDSKFPSEHLHFGGLFFIFVLWRFLSNNHPSLFFQ